MPSVKPRQLYPDPTQQVERLGYMIQQDHESCIMQRAFDIRFQHNRGAVSVPVVGARRCTHVIGPLANEFLGSLWASLRQVPVTNVTTFMCACRQFGSAPARGLRRWWVVAIGGSGMSCLSILKPMFLQP